jgi:hypothetical protein
VIDDAHEWPAHAPRSAGLRASWSEARRPCASRSPRAESRCGRGPVRELGERHLSRAELAFDAREAARPAGARRGPGPRTRRDRRAPAGLGRGLRAARARRRSRGRCVVDARRGATGGALAPEERRDLLLASLLDDSRAACSTRSSVRRAPDRSSTRSGAGRCS